MNQVTQNQCDIHTFDPAKRPDEVTAQRNHLKVHDMGIATTDRGKFLSLRTIMDQFQHGFIDVFKIDVEGAEEKVLPQLVSTNDGLLTTSVDQIAIEFHSVRFLKVGLDLLTSPHAGFGIVFARREDRCKECTEVTLVKLPPPSPKR
jgi:hypothetical protein